MFKKMLIVVMVLVVVGAFSFNKSNRLYEESHHLTAIVIDNDGEKGDALQWKLEGIDDFKEVVTSEGHVSSDGILSVNAPANSGSVVVSYEGDSLKLDYAVVK